jgi:hypothetical protein
VSGPGKTIALFGERSSRQCWIIDYLIILFFPPSEFACRVAGRAAVAPGPAAATAGAGQTAADLRRSAQIAKGEARRVRTQRLVKVNEASSA